MNDLQDVRCGACDRLWFRAVGFGSVIEILCKCGRLVRIDEHGHQQVVGEKQKRPA